jgi:MerR family transcriptional regulator, light-induced transcriptional regulator
VDRDWADELLVLRNPSPEILRGAKDEALLRVVERHVLPRLVLRTPRLIRRERFGDGISENVEIITGLALEDDDGRSRDLLARLKSDGASFGQLQIGILTPAARRLDSLWRNDQVSFLDVTLAAGNLQRLMRFVALDLMPRRNAALRRKSILVTPPPGEAHLFGAAMAAEFFRRDGWRVHFEPTPTPAGLADFVRSDWVDVLGVSVTGRRHVRALAETIRQVRAASMNGDLLVIAGGEALARDPDLLTAIGADAALAALEAAPTRTHKLIKVLFGNRH